MQITRSINIDVPLNVAERQEPENVIANVARTFQYTIHLKSMQRFKPSKIYVFFEQKPKK